MQTYVLLISIAFFLCLYIVYTRIFKKVDLMSVVFKYNYLYLYFYGKIILFTYLCDVFYV